MKRFASISDPSKIVLVIIVDDGPVRIETTGDPSHPTRVVQSHRPRLLFAPILDGDDVYGLTYGVRVAVPKITGGNSRLSFPLTWGGTKEAGIELDKNFDSGVLSRLLVGGGVSRSENPSFDKNDDRWRVAVIAEHNFTPQVRLGAVGAWQHVSFGDGIDERVFVRRLVSSSGRLLRRGHATRSVPGSKRCLRPDSMGQAWPTR